MSATPRVTVIMIFHQAERFIAEAIASVRTQTLDDWELLLVDDGSTDRSSAIAREQAATDPARIRVLTHAGHANRGMAASRNLGMAEARGRYIAFLDADDVFMPERLRLTVEALDGLDRPAVVITSELYWNSWSPVRPGLDVPQRDYEVATGVVPGVLMEAPTLLRLLVAPGRAQMPGICSITFHRLDADGLEGAPARFTDLYEDQCLISTLLAARPALVLDACLARYRMHPESATARAAERGEIGSRRIGSAEHRYLEWLERHLADNGVADAGLAAALRRRTWPYRHPSLERALAPWRRLWAALRRALVVTLRTLFDDRRFDGLRRVREAWRRRRIRRDQEASRPGRTP